MKDPYLYPNTEVLKNLAGITDENNLKDMEADYTCYRLSELAMDNSKSSFNFAGLCGIHYAIFQDVYDWAGKIRIINIEKAEPALGGISIEYADCFEVERELKSILTEMDEYPWGKAEFENIVKTFSGYMAKLWKVHPFREGNTRTIVIFCSRFIESKGTYTDNELFKDNAEYMRTSLVAATAIFPDIGDKRQSEYLERIVRDAFQNGKNMKEKVEKQVKSAGIKVSNDIIREIMYWNRKENKIHNINEIKRYFEQNESKVKCSEQSSDVDSSTHIAHK